MTKNRKKKRKIHTNLEFIFFLKHSFPFQDPLGRERINFCVFVQVMQNWSHQMVIENRARDHRMEWIVIIEAKCVTIPRPSSSSWHDDDLKKCIRSLLLHYSSGSGGGDVCLDKKCWWHSGHAWFCGPLSYSLAPTTTTTDDVHVQCWPYGHDRSILLIDSNHPFFHVQCLN